MMHACIAGELVRDPEKRQTKNGNAYATALLHNGECQGKAARVENRPSGTCEHEGNSEIAPIGKIHPTQWAFGQLLQSR